MVYAGCSFKSFSVFLLALKQQQNLVKILFSCIHFPVWPYPPKIMHKEKEEEKKKKYFIQVNCMGWQVWYWTSWVWNHPYLFYRQHSLFSYMPYILGATTPTLFWDSYEKTMAIHNGRGKNIYRNTYRYENHGCSHTLQPTEGEFQGNTYGKG